jgi:hypothetical protein
LPKPRSSAAVTLATFMPPEWVTNPDQAAVNTAFCVAVNSIAKQSQDLRVLVERAKAFGRSRGDLVRPCLRRTHVRVTPIDTKTPNANSAHNLATDHTRAAVIPSRPTYAEMAARPPPPPPPRPPQIRNFHQNRPPRRFDRPQRGRGTGPGVGQGYGGRHPGRNNAAGRGDGRGAQSDHD